jgi:MoaA/NifB/PqqE/SkfB family radical SAM enzyme
MCDYVQFNPQDEPELPLELLKTIIRDFADLGGEVLELSGGEPMMREGIYELVAEACSRGLQTLMVTNGTLIGDAEAEKLLKAGLTSVSFSLEGPESLNDHLRGRGNFQKTMGAIRSFLHQAKQPGFEVLVGVTLSKYNYKTMVDFTKYLLEEIGVHQITINPFEKWMLKGNNRETRPVEFEISNDLIPELTREIERLIEYGQSMPNRLPPAGFLRKIPDYFLGKRFIPAGGCTIPSTFCGVEANGWVYPCWKTRPAVGCLQETSLADILASRSYYDLRDRALAGKCDGCLTSCYTEIL